MRKSKRSDRTKTNDEKRNWVKLAFRRWAEAASENESDPLKIKDAPEWVFNAWVELAKTAFPRGWLPVEKWDAEFLGEFLGRYSSLPRLFAGEVPVGPETQADMGKLNAMMAGQPRPKNFKAVVKDAETIFDATEKMISTATAMAAGSTYEDQMAFLRGLKRGMEIKPEELATSRAFRRHTRTFLVLALFWRHWVKCRSVREIYGHLCKAIGEKKIGSFKTFETHVAKKIGLKLRSRGRPKAVK